MKSKLPQPEPAAGADVEDRYCGFRLRSVTWGYRQIFADTIEELFAEGRLGPHRSEVTQRFFGLMKQADQSCFDHVLRRFLGALNPSNRWIMDLPGVFADVTELGALLAADKLYHGTRFFETLAAGGLGSSPETMRECLGWMRRLREIDVHLAMAFLAGYESLSRRLRPMEMERYIRVGLEIHNRNAESGRAFLRGELQTCETYIRAITQEYNITDVRDPLSAMVQALTAQPCQIAGVSELDTDDLIERGTQVVAAPGHLYLPDRCRRFDTAALNRKWYVLAAVACASMRLEGSFAEIHGHRNYRTCAELVGRETWRTNLFQVVEFIRILRRAVRRWPGVRRLVAFGLDAERADSLRPGSPGAPIAEALDPAQTNPALETLRRIADKSVNCFDTAARLDEPWTREILDAFPALARESLRPTGFLADFLFPVSFSTPPSDAVVADLKQAARRGRSGGDDNPNDGGTGDVESRETDEDAEEEGRDREAAPAAFVYDEWDFQQNEYRPAWCHVHPRRVAPAQHQTLQSEWLDRARKVRAVFERLKPELAHREKYLPDGDAINVDRLIEYLVDRRRAPSPPARFYEKPLINHRDLAVLILLDISGSTGETLGDQQDRNLNQNQHQKVLDVEKQAAFILAQGLAALGDRFSICGFSSKGRRECEYLTFKDFDEPWPGEAVGRVMAAWPRNSTRIGPALRHAGAKLADQPSRKRLIILVTDGKPMDEGYDPNTRYAQHDVRMACEENARKEIATFAISTEENSLADMEIMFPRRRFVILPSIGRLPQILPQLYLRLTL